MIKRVFRQMLVSQILSSLAVTICMLIDSIMIGQFLGVDAMAAYGFATPVLLVFTAIGCMLSNGIQYICSSYMGKGDTKSIDKCYTTVLCVGIGISLIGMALVFIFIDPLTSLLGATKGTEIYDLTQKYLFGFLIGAPAVIGSQIMIPYLQMAGEQIILVIAVLLMTVVDIIADFLNVKLFDGGIFGMGLASSISYIVAFGFGLTYFLNKKKCMYHFNFRLFEFKQMKGVCVGGASAAINQASFTFLVLIVNNLLSNTVEGSNAVAAYSVISTMANICYAFGAGVGSIALMLAGIFYGEEDRNSIYSVVKTSVIYALILDLAVIIAFIIIAPFVAKLFIADNPDTLLLTTNGLRIFVLSILPSCLTTTFKQYYTGINRIGFSNLISFMQNFLYTAIFAVLFYFIFGSAYGVWAAFVAGETAALIVLSIIVWKKSNVPPTLSSKIYAYLPAEFGVDPSDSLEMVIRDGKDVITVSEAAKDFCLKNGQTARISNIIALSIEEMCNNIVSHGFKTGKENMIEVRLIHKEGNWIIRLRDNCVNFDPVNYMSLHKASSEDPTAHIGIRMVFAMVKDAKYVNSLGLNNLTLTI